MGRRSRRGFRSRPAIEKLVDARKYAAQDIDLFLLQSRPSEQSSQPRQQALRLSRVEEAHRDQRALGVGEQLLDFVKRGRRERGSGPYRFAACGEEQLVGGHLNRRSKIERGLEPRPSEETTRALALDLGEDPDVLLAMAGKVSADLQEIIRKRPQLFAQLIREMKHLPDRAVLRLVREVRDGDW